jgi:signal transduction histidine kinase
MARSRGRIGGIIESLVAQGTRREPADAAALPARPGSLEKRVRVTNAGALFATLVMVATIPLDVVEAPRWMVAIDVFACLAFPSLVLLNRLGRTTVSRLAFIALANLLTFANAVGLGPDSGVEMLFIALVSLPFLLFDLNNRAQIAFGLLLPVAGFAINASEVFAPVRPEGYSAAEYHLYSAVLTLATVLFSFFQISRANVRAEQALRDDIAARERAERELAVSRQASITAAKLAALGEMSANVAHEVNNPLAAILLRARRLENLAGKHRLDTDAVVRTAQQIGSTVDRIRRIVDALRFFARQGDEDPMRPEPVRRIVSDTVELCAQRFRMADIELAVHHADEDAFIECRGPQISQILVNLLSNSFDAVQGRPVRRVVVTAEAQEQQVRIAVTDTGAGIPQEVAHRIMEPFFTTKDIGHGTGLGLSLSKGIAEAHGGQLALDAGARETRFVLSLRRCAPPEMPSTAELTAGHSPG